MNALIRWRTLLCLLIFFGAGQEARAQTLDSLSSRIRSIDSQISRLQKEYDREKKANQARIQKAEEAQKKNETTTAERSLKEAYTSADHMNMIRKQMNDLRIEHEALCGQWRNLYRKTIDEMLEAAEREKDRAKKGETGSRLQQYQSINAELCAISGEAQITHDWKALRIESYDGPQEIQEKIQLLKDIYREVTIVLTKLDQQYQDAVMERKTKERAEEFIEEATLFNDNLTIRPSPAPATAGPNSPIEVMDGTANSPTSLGATDIHGKESFEQFEANYVKKRADFLSQQKDLQQTIQDFETRAKALMLP